MAKFNKIKFLLFVSLMISPAYALDVIISGAHRNFKQRTEIATSIANGVKVYRGTLNPLIYEAGLNISKVIVYIIDRSRYVEISRRAVRETRLQIAHELGEWNYELVFLGIENFDDDEHHLIGAFILEKIRPHRDQIDQGLIIEVIGENRFDRSYQCIVVVFERYQEQAQICGGTLLAWLRHIPHGAFRPVGGENKMIKLRGYLPIVREVTWSVRVLNGTYAPEIDVNSREYNFRMNHPDKNINVLVLGGTEYSDVTSLGDKSSQISIMNAYLLTLRGRSEVFYIMGAFNFDWSEVYLIAQIILQHTRGRLIFGYNVCACGFGMFDTNYLNWNANDGGYFSEPHQNVFNIRNALLGEVGARIIVMRYYENGWISNVIPISSNNGQYAPRDGFRFSFPRVNQRIAFIVYSSSEVNASMNQPMVHDCMTALRRSHIFVILIEAINFEPYDIHIIAEWIEEHRGQIDPEQIAILGGGTFDTIFQSPRTTYNTFFNIGKNEMRTIRNAYVAGGNDKRIFVAKIDDANFEAWSYAMNTIVNGVYEPDLIPDKNMFDTTNGRGLFFIITNAHNFQRISAIPNVGAVTATFRATIDGEYPNTNWSVFLVGLDNFREIDAPRFAEFVKKQTADERPLLEFVRVLNYSRDYVPFQYNDTESFPIEFNPRILTRITWLFRMGSYI